MVKYELCCKCHSDNVRLCVEPGWSYWVCRDCSPKYTEVYDENNLPDLSRGMSNNVVLFAKTGEIRSKGEVIGIARNIIVTVNNEQPITKENA